MSVRATLIAGGEPRVLVPMARLLEAHGIPVIAAGLPTNPSIVQSRSFRRYVALQADNPEQLRDLVAAEGCDLILAASDTALSVISQQHASLSALATVGCPPAHIAKRVLDKTITLDTAARLGIRAPVPYENLGPEELQSLKYPVIAKPRAKDANSPADFKVRYYRNEAELAAAFAADAAFGRRYLVQSYCEGYGVGVAMLMHNGEAVATFQHRRIRELPFSGGVSIVAESEQPATKLKAQALALLRELEWRGIAMVEFRYDPKSDEAVLMEVNGRYWGTTALALQTGIEFPWYEWQLSHGQIPVAGSGRPAQRMRWLAGDIQRLADMYAPVPAGSTLTLPSRGRETLQFARDFVSKARDPLWSKHDPMPAMAELKQAIRSVLVATVKRVLRSAIPKDVLFARQLGAPASSIYLKSKWKLRFPPRFDGRKAVGSVLFVCHGNIIRSAMAAEYFRTLVNGIEVLSAGLHAKPGKPADPRAVQLAPDFGVSLEHHRASLLDDTMIDQADAIFVMDHINEAKLLAAFPRAAAKLHLLGGSTEIPDPYTGSIEDVRKCYEQLTGCVHKLADQLSSTRRKS
jgi:protein-tyrosine-phosphatase/predicted ATP-grasp superfamily ATP-dependent carboligase